MKSTKYKFAKLAALVVFGFGTLAAEAANVALVGNGASSGPIIATSAFQDIALGTRVRIGKFSDTNALNTTINNFKTSVADYATTLTWLNNTNNFIDLGTNVANYGNASQTGTGVSSNAIVFNNTTSLTVNGVTATRNIFNGSIANVNYSSSIGFSTPVFLWVAYNNELGIFRDSGWVTPVSDLTALTLNLNTISNAQTGNTEILLGGYQDYAGGTDLLTLIPEPATASLLMVGLGLLLSARKRSQKAAILKKGLLFILVGFAGAFSTSAQTVSTPIVGFYKKSFPAGGSLQTVALLKPISFQGTASAVSGTSVACSTANWVVNAYATANGLPNYYVEITSGPLTGYLFDIISNTSTAITVDSSIVGAGTNPTFLIRQHTKLSDALAGATGLQDYNDQVTVYNADSTSTSFLRDSSVPSGWVDAGTFSESDAVIYPGQGYVLTTGSSGNYTISGTLKTTQTVIPLYPGAVNIVSLANPGGITKDIQSIGLGAGLADYSDQLATYANDGSLSTQNALIFGGVADGWLDAGSFAPASGVNVEGISPLIVTVTGPSTWVLNPPLSQ